MKKNQQGFTLIEVLFGIVIFAFGILAVASMQLHGIRANYLSATLTEATTLAGDRLEKLMASDYDDTVLDEGTHEQTWGEYTVSWDVVVDSPVVDSKTVIMTVTWSERGSQRNVTMQFIKANV
ncbi:MAG: prepilin-type N-terminal cleavage/methylation domain-containing protein [Deltaproteobacteria bacterium]|nr:MAG: prepilin-type N-terminal cleavage/methylation domain-containing protein [Deltaproteobacteria bacterium]